MTSPYEYQSTQKEEGNLIINTEEKEGIDKIDKIDNELLNWLINNDLKIFLPFLQKIKITLESLKMIDYDLLKMDIMEYQLPKDIPFGNSLKAKFLGCVKNLQISIPIVNDHSYSSKEIIHVMVAPEEMQYFNEMNKKYIEMSEQLQWWKQKFLQLNEMKEEEERIIEFFKQLIEILYEKEKQIIQKFHFIKQFHINSIQMNINSIDIYLKYLSQVKNKYQKNFTISMDMTERIPMNVKMMKDAIESCPNIKKYNDIILNMKSSNEKKQIEKIVNEIEMLWMPSSSSSSSLINIECVSDNKIPVILSCDFTKVADIFKDSSIQFNVLYREKRNAKIKEDEGKDEENINEWKIQTLNNINKENIKNIITVECLEHLKYPSTIPQEYQIKFEIKDSQYGLAIHSNSIHICIDDLKSKLKLKLKLKLEINPNKYGQNVELVNKHRVRIKKGSIGTALSAYTIELSKYQYEVEWSVKMHSIGYFSWIGFVTPEHNHDLNSHLTGENQWSIGFGLSNRIGGIHKAVNLKPENGNKEMKNGDVIRFVVNVKEKICRLFHEEEELQVIFRDLPHAIVPAISNFKSGEYGDFEFV